ncbi:hypothetical protein P280DRAFT_412071 [Massarina eburnea CBS 473.64]|uniref:Uncharacterized protein n=1 Tax=Massarina eburnea CBS 473.64 TaxID=1395130 RepID=A0A6A6RJE8_9PLEO|nr:hypothetical protein P280DRAFT_412071 [Massarina eburnea CBS 473.64]
MLKARAATAKRARIPNCTHVSMERVYLGEEGYCAACGRLPALGFLYACRQDCDYDSLASRPGTGDANANDQKSDLCRELEMIGLSKSIIATAEEGKYTEEQLEKLKTLKLELNQVISGSAQGSQATRMEKKLVAAEADPSNNDGAFNSILADIMHTPRCNFRACHSCRPYFAQRLYISFDAVFSNEFRPVSPEDMDHLTTKSAQVVRSIGLAKPSLPQPTHDLTHHLSPSYSDIISDTPSQDSVLTFRTTQSDIDNIDSTHRHRSRFYKMGYQSSGDIASDLSRLPLFSRHILKTAFQGIFRPSRQSSSEGSNITLPMSRTGTARDLGSQSSMGEFDMGALRRVRKQKERNDLRYGIGGGFEDLSRSADAHQQGASNEGEDCSASSSVSDFTVYSCVSEGSEVEVEGGVALTEEAVGTNTPDIISAPESQEEPVSVKRDQMDLADIMTQV